MQKDSRIYVAGHRGLVGSAIFRALQAAGYQNVFGRTRAELDLQDTSAVRKFFAAEKPDYVIDAAAKVGGILANDTEPAEFIYQNLAIQNNIIHSSYEHDVKRLLFLGSACVYPKICEQPIKEEYMLTGALEPTNEAYAIAKIAGYVMCRSYNRQYGTDYISVMPANLYGPGDNFDLNSSHVIPALIRKFSEAKKTGARSVTLWGTGRPTRDFMYVDDMADACVFIMNVQHEYDLLNIGTGVNRSIAEIAEALQRVSGYEGKLVWDTTKPDGQPRRRVDTARLEGMGWKSKIPLEEGLRKTYAWYEEHAAS